MKLETTFKFYKVDDAPYFGAYKVGSLTDNDPTLMFSLEAIIHAIKDDNDKTETFKDIMLSTLTHEFCHSMQEWLGKEFDELEVEKILGAYNDKWNVFEAEQPQEDDGAVFQISEFLTALDGLELDAGFSGHHHDGANMMKDKIRELFAPMMLWHEAEKRNAAEKEALAEKINTGVPNVQ